MINQSHADLFAGIFVISIITPIRFNGYIPVKTSIIVLIREVINIFDLITVKGKILTFERFGKDISLT